LGEVFAIIHLSENVYFPTLREGELPIFYRPFYTISTQANSFRTSEMTRNKATAIEEVME
jgi:hypothetical protein